LSDMAVLLCCCCVCVFQHTGCRCHQGDAVTHCRGGARWPAQHSGRRHTRARCVWTHCVCATSPATAVTFSRTA
jgi:hypothetical protein